MVLMNWVVFVYSGSIDHLLLKKLGSPALYQGLRRNPTRKLTVSKGTGAKKETATANAQLEPYLSETKKKGSDAYI